MESGKHLPLLSPPLFLPGPNTYLLSQVRDRFVPRQPLMSITQLIEKIQSDELFGLVVCDVHVPEHLKSYYAQFPPVFKNVGVSLEDVGPHTKQLCERYGYLKKPQRTLITSFFGKQMLLTTSQIKWYLDHGE